MASIIKKLHKNGDISPPMEFVAEPSLEVMMGSVSYGISGNDSDVDVYGVTIQPLDMLFPNHYGHVQGFGTPRQFESFQKHHIMFNDKEYDVNIYSITKTFSLCYKGTPNLIDSIFVPERCVLYADNAGKHIRANRRMFLSKHLFNALRGYANAELKKLERVPNSVGKRKELVDRYGYDVKSASHVARLCLQAEQVLVYQDLDLESNKEMLKAVRRGEYTLQELREWFRSKERSLEELNAKSDIPRTPNFSDLNEVLQECIEIKYGSVDKMINSEATTIYYRNKLERIQKIIEED